jgi:phosphoglucomutase
MLKAGANTRWYRDRDPWLFDRFADELEQTLVEVARQPEPLAPDADGDRRRLLGRFPYAVVYCENPTDWLVVAIARTSQRPRDWRRRRSRPGSKAPA